MAIASTGQIAAQTPQLMQVWGVRTTSISRPIVRQSVGQTSTQSPQSVHSLESISGSSERTKCDFGFGISDLKNSEPNSPVFSFRVFRAFRGLSTKHTKDTKKGKPRMVGPYTTGKSSRGETPHYFSLLTCFSSSASSRVRSSPKAARNSASRVSGLSYTSRGLAARAVRYLTYASFFVRTRR